jgi:molybdopterin converting factor subunit 1
MNVAVKLFARAKDLAGTDVLCVELPDAATVLSLRQQLAAERPALAELLRSSAIAVNGDFALDGHVLCDQAEVAILPPVSGGCLFAGFPIL